MKIALSSATAASLWLSLALAAETGAAHAEAGGLPQMRSETYPSQVFWLLISFATLYFICSRIFLPRIGGIIEERRNSIADDLDKAAEFRGQAEAAEAAYLKSLADARARAAQIASDTRASLDAEIKAMEDETNAKLERDVASAEARIAEMAARAKDSVREAAAETTKALVTALIDETPSDDVVEAALTHVASA